MTTQHPRRRAEIFAAAEDDDRRFSTSATADERTLLVDILGAQRATLEMKCAGLEGELAQRSVEPSTLSLLGLARHLADMERRWASSTWSRSTPATTATPTCSASASTERSACEAGDAG